MHSDWPTENVNKFADWSKTKSPLVRAAATGPVKIFSGSQSLEINKNNLTSQCIPITT